MDLLDFSPGDLYFEAPLAPEVEAMLRQASVAYREGAAELPLLRAFLHSPDHLTVLVALYRFYFYQHRYQDAFEVAERACRVAARPIDFPAEWRELRPFHLSSAVTRSMGLVRFYLLALKASGYLLLRLGRLEEGRERLAAVRALDPPDRLGTGVLLEVLEERLRSRSMEPAA